MGFENGGQGGEHVVVKVGECSRRRRRRRRRRVGARVGAGKGDVAVMPFFRNVAPVCFFGLSAYCYRDSSGGWGGGGKGDFGTGRETVCHN